MKQDVYMTLTKSCEIRAGRYKKTEVIRSLEKEKCSIWNEHYLIKNINRILKVENDRISELEERKWL